MLRQRLLLVSLLCVFAAQQSAACVVLLHGLGRTHRAMSEIAERLQQQGFEVFNKGYPSREADVASLASKYVARGVDYCKAAAAEQIHFVTHSLGGILVRQFLQDNEVPALGRVVMLAPPNHGSEVADYLKDYDWFKAALGPVGPQLHTGPDSVPNSLGPIPGEIGIITGTESLDPWFAWMFKGPNDGKVSVDSARLDEMSDFLVVEHGHTFITGADDVIEQIAWFLLNGEFNPDLMPEPNPEAERNRSRRDKK